MRVLSLHQPFATLVTRGVMPFRPHVAGTPWRGRIAIHASQAAPSHEVLERAIRHPRLAQTFASQGWTSRDDLLALPRSAVVGTVEVTAVKTVRQVLLDPSRADRNPDDPLDITAAGGDGRHDPAAFVMPVWPDDYLWMLAGAIEFAPITGVRGRQNLWDLPEDVARAVADAERGAREHALTAGGREPAALKPQTKRRARDWLRDINEADRARKAEHADRLARDARAAERDMRRFADADFEDHFEGEIARYVAMYPTRTVDGEELVRIAGPRIQALFPGVTWTTRVEFERRMRAHIRETADSETTARKPLWDLPRHLPRLAKIVEIGRFAGVHVRPASGRAAKRSRQKRLEERERLDELEPIARDGTTELHVQRVDPLDPPDPRDQGDVRA
jgi:hypothetical protein